MNERIRLSQGALTYLQTCTVDSEFGRFARSQIRLHGEEPSEEVIWNILEENVKYADVINLSSRPVGNEEVVGATLMSLPPAFSHYLLEAYRRQGYLERGDVEHAYRNREFYPALTMAIFRNLGRCRKFI